MIASVLFLIFAVVTCDGEDINGESVGSCDCCVRVQLRFPLYSLGSKAL